MNQPFESSMSNRRNMLLIEFYQATATKFTVSLRKLEIRFRLNEGF
jgi:hypothetical protein